MRHEQGEKQLGVVLVFKAGTTPQDVAAALAKLANVVDANYYLGGKPQVHSFNPAHGGPVWYVP